MVSRRALLGRTALALAASEVSPSPRTSEGNILGFHASHPTVNTADRSQILRYSDMLTLASWLPGRLGREGRWRRAPTPSR